ncbi:hypothetical protein IIA15_03445 [candidate division TA06 bacterium]|nr:hypothetical protein [candidate division TA06 bacterium]
MKNFDGLLMAAGVFLILTNSGGYATEPPGTQRIDGERQMEEGQRDLQRVLRMSEVIPYSWSYKTDGKGTIFTVDSDNPIMRELKLELDLAEEQMRMIQEFAELLIEFHQDVGKALVHFEILQSLEKEGGRRLSEEELKDKKELENKADQIERELRERLQEIKKSLKGKSEVFFQWLQEAEYLNSAVSGRSKFEGEPYLEHAFDQFILQKDPIVQYLNRNRERLLKYMAERLSLSSEQKSEIDNLLKLQKIEILRLRHKLHGLHYQVRLSVKAEEVLGEILQKKRDSEQAIGEILTVEQRERLTPELWFK